MEYLNTEINFLDMSKLAAERVNHSNELDRKIQKRQIYLDMVCSKFEELGMSCEVLLISRISSSHLRINGIYVIIDYSCLEFKESHMIKKGQEALVDFLKNNPKEELGLGKFINIRFESPEHFQRFYKVHNLHLFLNDNLKGLNKLGIFEIKKFKDFYDTL